jgi:UPF0755 protein
MKTSFTSSKVLVIAAFVLMAFTLISAGWGWFIAQPGPLEAQKTVVIRPGMSLAAIAGHLAGENVIAGARRFQVAVRVVGLGTTLQAGEYTFPPHISLRSVVNKLAIGDVDNRRLTVPEGLPVAQVIAKLNALEELMGEPLTPPAEGTLFPDTYAYRYGDTRLGLMQRMQKRMVEELAAAWLMRDPAVPLKSQEELLILASIVEKETAVPAERARVAGVFVNRLNKGMKLQSDPTVIYGASDYAGDLTTFHLREDQPYNTYMYRGLPPTPIASPGRDALQATAQPEAHAYLYFVADGSGGHTFATTHAQHLRNVEAYLRIYRKRQHGQ